MESSKKIIAGASSISAINFVAPLYYDDNELLFFINEKVLCSSKAIGSDFSTSSRASLPLPFLISTERQEATQAFIPFTYFQSRETRNTLIDSLVSKNELINLTKVWKKIILAHIDGRTYPQLMALILAKIDHLTERLRIELNNETEVSCFEASKMFIEIIYQEFKPNSKIKVLSEKDLMKKIGVEKMNSSIFETCLNFLKQCKHPSNNHGEELPFGGKIIWINNETKEQLEFDRLILLADSSIRAFNNNSDDYINISKKNGFVNIHPNAPSKYLKITGALKAETFARISRTITVPWYLNVVRTTNETTSENNFHFEEVISPLKSVCMERRPKIAGGNGIGHNPSGYSLMDYATDNNLIWDWIESCLKIRPISGNFREILKLIAYLNYGSENSKSTQTSRSLFISKIVIKNFHWTENQKKFTCPSEYDKGATYFNSKTLEYLLFQISLFSDIRSSFFSKNDLLKTLTQMSHHGVVLNDANLNITKLKNNILKTMEDTSNHIKNITIGRLNLSEFVTEKVLKSKLELVDGQPLFGYNIWNTLTEISVEMDLNDIDVNKFATISRFYLNLFELFLNKLIQYWINYSVYSLKASLINLYMFFDSDKLQEMIKNIKKERQTPDIIYFSTNWKK